MAHSCPDCGQTCYCNGDIGDCCDDFPENVMKCTHFKQCEPDIDDDDE